MRRGEVRDESKHITAGLVGSGIHKKQSDSVCIASDQFLTGGEHVVYMKPVGGFS